MDMDTICCFNNMTSKRNQEKRETYMANIVGNLLKPSNRYP